MVTAPGTRPLQKRSAMRDPRPAKGGGAGSQVSPPTVTPVLVAELLVEGDRMPVYVHVIEHPVARVLVDTGMTQLHPADPRVIPLSAQADFDLASIDIAAGVQSSSAATWQSSSPSSTSRAPKASGWSARSSLSRSGSRTSTSRGGDRATSTSDSRVRERSVR